jgi:haloacetate dehalogenase
MLRRMDAPAILFPGFTVNRVATSGAIIHAVSAGSGPPVLLLHGFPQSHVEWHKIAPRLAEDFTVVATDLRGYGDSSKPPDGDNHSGYSKRATAQDQVEVMRHFGFDKFAVVGHDRGGRVGHRMALDHPDRVSKLAVIDIVPTYKLLRNVTKEFATAYYHWFLLIQPAPLPENIIARILDLFADRGDYIHPLARAEYLRCFSDPATVHGACEDYRASASIDLDHDDADLDRKVACPLLALWGQHAPMHKLYDVLAAWRERASNVSGNALPGGHFLPEELPAETVAELRAFLRG